MPSLQHPPIQTVAIVGAGAMGAMYADHFSRAGFRTLILADRERAARMRDEPITVNGTRLQVEIVDPDEAARTAGGSTVGLVIVAVKHRQLADAADLIRPFVSAETTILSILNGLESEEVILRELQEGNAEGAGAATSISAEQVPLCTATAMGAERDGSAVSYIKAGQLAFGPADGGTAAASPRLDAVRTALSKAGLEWSAPDDMRHAMWWKFMVNVSINQASAVLRAPNGAFVSPGPARDLMNALVDEVRAVATAEGVHLTDEDVDRYHAALSTQPASSMTSMCQDVIAGRPTEVDIFAGRVVELGRRHTIPVPHNQTMLWILRALAEPAAATTAS